MRTRVGGASICESEHVVRRAFAGWKICGLCGVVRGCAGVQVDEWVCWGKWGGESEEVVGEVEGGGWGWEEVGVLGGA